MKLFCILLTLSICIFIHGYDIIQSNTSIDERIHIVYALDKHMLPLTLISVESIIEYHSNISNIYFHFVLINITWNKEFINNLHRTFDYKINFESITWSPIPNIIQEMKIRKTERQDLAAPANYARFYISMLFPNLKRFIYLDNDIIAIKPLDDLWNIDLGDKYLVGMVNECGKWFQQHVIENQNYNLTHPIVKKVFNTSNVYTLIKHYKCHPNAGVMLVNQELLNKYNILTKIEELIRINQYEFIYKLGSQPLIVLTSWNHYLSLSKIWNTRNGMKLTLNHTGLIHYNGSPEKKFMYRLLHKFLEPDLNIDKLIYNIPFIQDERERIWMDISIKLFNKSYGKIKLLFTTEIT